MINFKSLIVLSFVLFFHFVNAQNGRLVLDSGKNEKESRNFVVPYAGGFGIVNKLSDESNSHYMGGIADFGIGFWNEKPLIGKHSEENYGFLMHYGPRFGSEIVINWPGSHCFAGPKIGYQVMKELGFARLSLIEYTNLKKQTTVICPEIGIWYGITLTTGWNIALTHDNFNIAGWKIGATLEIPIQKK